ncbi:hypothetical protein GCM10023264_21320 [Sphingomonas daechungensis]|uniref:Outer membrane beta-barrel protein n=1 Tax=Sphingomonas daechungensis TaxID=1176646 RepID=A0ABX6T4C5_9SPHN|nr:outer membrane beta-barrel protein [Sphingomonas daechungensis]QNP43767.1 outer membrane beta-barrel protein [Sphingomonas daechungensis]
MAIASPAAAAETDPSFNLRAGVLIARVHTLVRVDPNATLNSQDVVFERDLGFERGPDILFFEGEYRFARRWKVSAEYQRLDRENSKTLDRSIQIGDTTFPLNAAVSGRVRSNLYKVQFGWSAVRNDKAEVGISLGAHLTNFLVSVEGQGSVGGSGILVQRDERRSTFAPLPNAGLFGSVKVGRDFKIGARANYFQLKIDDFKGGLTDAEANVEWKATRNFGVGVGYRFLKYRLDLTKDKFDGAVRYRFRGPALYVTAAF